MNSNSCEVAAPLSMLGWKLFRQRKDGSYGPLFINMRQKLYPGVEYPAECHPTKGYALRPGWHICSKKSAPHLSKKGRVWVRVAFDDFQEHVRPKCQGGLWYTANRMVILGPACQSNEHNARRLARSRTKHQHQRA